MTTAFAPDSRAASRSASGRIPSASRLTGTIGMPRRRVTAHDARVGELLDQQWGAGVTDRRQRDHQRMLRADGHEDLGRQDPHLPATDPVGARGAMLRAAGMWRVFEQRRTVDVSADLEASRQFRDMRMRWQRVQRRSGGIASSDPGNGRTYVPRPISPPTSPWRAASW